ncbi:lysophospholipid acyltransferase family protein [Janibacter limosus]|uniref:lysophospholipid acyltransferase family protein n=1 Tax=Janibacter limosus TaxID=53458 RepID=UPI0035DACCEF|nr:lysophospholipid acyltransferase family protein [Janibacter limosus]
MDQNAGVTTPRQHVKNAAGFVPVWLVAKVAHRVRFRAGEIPRTGPVILVANHLTMTDPLAVARVVIGHRRFPHFLAMQEVFGWPGVGALVRVTGQIPVARGSAAAGDALDSASERLDQGQLVALYPEGRLTTEVDRMPGPARTGAARLALRHPEAVVIPIGTWGPQQGHHHIWHRHTACLSVGPRLDLSVWAERTDDAAAREVTDVIMTAIRDEIGHAQQMWSAR